MEASESEMSLNTWLGKASFKSWSDPTSAVKNITCAVLFCTNPDAQSATNGGIKSFSSTSARRLYLFNTMIGLASGCCCKNCSSLRTSIFSSSFNLLFLLSTLLTYLLYSLVVIFRMAWVANRNMFLICVSLLSLKPDFCPVNP